MIKTGLIATAGILWVVWVLALLAFRRRPELKVGTPREFVMPLAALAIGLWWWFSRSDWLGNYYLSIYMKAAVINAALLTGLWLISLAKRDAGIMDVAYPMTAALPVLVLLARRGSWSPHEIFLAVLVALWSTRMSLHIGLRNSGHGEDARYAAWRRRFGRNWWWWSFFMIFAMQGVMLWLWSIGLVAAVVVGPQPLGWQHGLALLLFAVGFGFQTTADLQLERFKRERIDRSKVLDTGVWALSRHPNYFGESVVWWGFAALALVHPWGWLALVCPIYVTWFMSAGSATPMQERYLQKSKPAYADYMRRVPIFFPWTRP